MPAHWTRDQLNFAYTSALSLFPAIADDAWQCRHSLGDRRKGWKASFDGIAPGVALAPRFESEEGEEVRGAVLFVTCDGEPFFFFFVRSTDKLYKKLSKPWTGPPPFVPAIRPKRAAPTERSPQASPSKRRRGEFGAIQEKVTDADTDCAAVRLFDTGDTGALPADDEPPSLDTFKCRGSSLSSSSSEEMDLDLPPAIAHEAPPRANGDQPMAIDREAPPRGDGGPMDLDANALAHGDGVVTEIEELPSSPVPPPIDPPVDTDIFLAAADRPLPSLAEIKARVYGRPIQLAPLAEEATASLGALAQPIAALVCNSEAMAEKRAHLESTLDPLGFKTKLRDAAALIDPAAKFTALCALVDLAAQVTPSMREEAAKKKLHIAQLARTEAAADTLATNKLADAFGGLGKTANTILTIMPLKNTIALRNCVCGQPRYPVWDPALDPFTWCGACWQRCHACRLAQCPLKSIGADGTKTLATHCCHVQMLV